VGTSHQNYFGLLEPDPDGNLAGAMLCTREVAKYMVDRKQGVKLFTSSMIQFNPAYKEAAYRVSKTGVQVFAETAAIELAPGSSYEEQSQRNSL
jgi:NAD(P)-dependent dehydrogenase (short-subunit alcohol dehydrogenase family)